MGAREDARLDVLVENWVSINKFEDKMAWEAWIGWRKAQLRCHQEPESLTVPSPFPPTTVASAKEYTAALKEIRSAIGWKDSRAALPKDISAWMGAGL